MNPSPFFLSLAALFGLFLSSLSSFAFAANDYEAASRAVRTGNPAEAYFLMRPLAEDGDEEAAYFLGWMYHEGLGLVADDRKAVRWWRPAAEDGHVESMMSLGLLYQRGGHYIKKDTVKAVEYYLQAAAEGEEDARLNIAALLLRDDMPAIRRIRSLLRSEPEVLGEMTEVAIEYASAREEPRHGARAIATMIKGTEMVKIATQDEWLYVGLPAKRRLAWIHESAIRSIRQAEDEDD